MKKLMCALIALFFVSGAFAQQQKIAKVSENQQVKKTKITSLGIPASIKTAQLNNSTAVVLSEQQLNSTGQIPVSNLRSGAKGLLSQNFDAVAFPPASWSVSGLASSWYNSSNSAITQFEAAGTPINSGHFAYFDCFRIANNGTASLITPVLHPDATNNTLNYKVNYYLLNSDYIATGAKLYIEFSTDGGTTWTTSTTNVLAALTGYNVSSTGWISLTASLAAYNTMAVQVRFRAVSDYGGFGLGIDEVTGPNADVTLPLNDLADTKTFCDFNGYGFYSYVPVTQISPVYFAMDVANNGSAAQNNITLTAAINSTTATVASAAYPSLASATHDTLVTAAYTPPSTANVLYTAALNVSASGITDVSPTDNIDTVSFAVTASQYLRGGSLTNIISQTSFGTDGGSGTVYTSSYHFPTAGRVDSISAYIYSGTGAVTAPGSIIKGILYEITATDIVAVDSTANYTIVSGDLNNFKTLGFVTPKNVAAGSFYLAGIRITTTGTNKVYLGTDNNSLFDLSLTTSTWLPNATTPGWYSGLTSQPLIGVIMGQASTDATLSNLTTGGTTVTGFASTTYTYNVVLPYGTTVVPTVTGIATNSNATVVVTPAASLPGSTTVVVTAQDGTTQLTYTINYTIAPASNVATLSNLTSGGTTVSGFASSTYSYNVVLPFGTTVVPTVTGIATDANATVVVTPAASLPGATNVVVTAQDGTTQLTYTINYTIATSVSTDATLSNLTTGGASVSGFASSTYSYNVVLPYGTTVVPTVTATPANAAATYVITPATSLPGSTTVVVTAQDGTTQLTYTINYTLAAPSTDATLSDLTSGGITVAGFASSTYSYNVELPAGTTVVPTVTGIATDVNATVVVTPATALPGTTTVVVTAQDGTTQLTYTIHYTVAAQTYTVTFSVVGSNGTLAATVDAAAITSPATVEAGKNVIFTAAPANNFQVKEWKLNNVVVAGNVTNTYTLSTIAANSTVTVEFELIDGINEATENVVSIYPNPANDVVTVKMNTTISKIEVVSLNGQIVAESLLNNNEGSINISTIANGMYFLRIETANGITMNKIQISK